MAIKLLPELGFPDKELKILNRRSGVTTTPPVPTLPTISGTILTGEGDPIANVSVSNGVTTETTDALGQYTFTDLAMGTYIITPTLTGYTFSPESITREVVVLDMIADFTGTAVPQSLQLNVTLSGSYGINWNTTDGGDIYVEDGKGPQANNAPYTVTPPIIALITANQLPVEATILGLQFVIRVMDSNGTDRINHENVRVTSSGTSIGTDHAIGEVTQSWATYTFGSDTDTWGADLTATKLNSGNYGVGWSCYRYGGSSWWEAKIDTMQITVWYTV